MSNKVMDQIVAINENDNPTIQYASVEALKDGRGYTCGKAGFTTNDGDALQVIREFAKTNSDDPLCKFQGQLLILSSKGSGSTLKLWATGFPKAWKNACANPNFIAAQNIVCDQEYYNPAVDLAHKTVSNPTPLLIAMFYDTAIQHGVGLNPDDYQDSLCYIIDKAKQMPGIFFLSFCQVRKQVLYHPTDKSTAKAWSESVERVTALQNLNATNPQLISPFHYNPWDNSMDWMIK